MALKHNAADHWQRRAEETRALAADMHDLHAKETMLQIAQRYEQMAERAAAQDEKK